MIDGGTITSIAQNNEAAVIGSGFWAECGNITITSNVTKVTAIQEEEIYSYMNIIGSGRGGYCGTITIGGKVGSIKEGLSYTYEP